MGCISLFELLTLNPPSQKLNEKLAHWRKAVFLW